MSSNWQCYYRDIIPINALLILARSIRICSWLSVPWLIYDSSSWWLVCSRRSASDCSAYSLFSQKEMSKLMRIRCWFWLSKSLSKGRAAYPYTLQGQFKFHPAITFATFRRIIGRDGLSLSITHIFQPGRSNPIFDQKIVNRAGALGGEL